MFGATITITVAPSTDRVLNRVNQDGYGSEYAYASATEACRLLIRHTTDSADADGIIMKRHNVFFERVIYPTPTAEMQKFTATSTIRHGKFNDPALSATLMDGLSDWLISGTILADLSVGVN